MRDEESLHAPPDFPGSTSPCCGRTLDELPPYDRIVFDLERVTCGRLSPADAAMLSGQPVVQDEHHEQVVYSMAATVCILSNGALTLTTAHDKVNAAIREILPIDRPLASWSAELMVRVTARAQELSLL